MKEIHTLDEEGNVSHYDIMFEHGLEQNVPVATLNILQTEAHEHAINWDKNQEVLDEKKKKLDPVGKEDGDVDNDGDKDASDSYLMNRRRAVAKAMGKKTKKEEVELEEKNGLYANIHAKKAWRSPAKPGDKDYPAKGAFKKAVRQLRKVYHSLIGEPGSTKKVVGAVEIMPEIDDPAGTPKQTAAKEDAQGS